MLLAAVVVLVAYAALRPSPDDAASPGATPPEAEVLSPPLTVPEPKAKPAPPAEPAAEDAGEAGETPPLTELMEGDSAPPRALVLSALRGAVESYLPDRKLSSDQYARLADAVETLRGSQEELRELDYTAENAARRRELVDAVGNAGAGCEYILEMSPGEFTERAQPGAGLSQDVPGEPVPPPEFLDDVPPPAG